MSSRRIRLKPGRWGWLAGLMAVAMLAGGLYVGFNLYSLITGIQDDTVGPSIAKEVRPDERINILVLGQDWTPGEPFARSDAMMVVSVDPLLMEVGLLSIPRDTRVTIPGRPQPEKAGHALAHGGDDLSRRTVEAFMGVDIHHTVVIDFDGFIGIVDALGGVAIDVERHLQYADSAQNLYIDIPPGVQHMDGELALEYVRYRTDSDIYRIQRQQQLVQALSKRFFHVRSLFNLAQLRDQVVAHVRTDLDASSMWRLVDLSRRIQPEALSLGTVPGRDALFQEGGQTVYYWLADEAASRVEVDRLMRGIDPERNSRWHVRVLNGNGVGGTASQVAEQLERWGYRVTEIGDADHFDHAQTLIVSHVLESGGNDTGDDKPSQEKASQLLARDLFYLLEQAPLLGSENMQVGGGAEPAIHFTLVVGQDILRDGDELTVQGPP